MLAVIAIALPLKFGQAGDGVSADACLRMADAPRTDSQSVPELERCAAAVPDDAELHADLGAAYEAAARPQDAERAFRRAIAIAPDYADAHVRLAMLLAARGANDEAREHAATALKIQPNRSSIRSLIARLSVTQP